MPLDEASGSQYRKIALNGAPLSDNKPQQNKESDQPDESTFIDALTLGLRHDTTDSYLSVPASDLALSVRRSTVSEAWNDLSSIDPMGPNRPFGLGWTSNISAIIEIKKVHKKVYPPDGGDGKFVEETELTASDENGSSHRFGAFAESPGSGYVPIPTGRHEQPVYLSRLNRLPNGQYQLIKKYGSTLTYEMTLVTRSHSSKSSPTADPVTTSYSYARLLSVVDRYGRKLNYTYNDGSVIPSKIQVEQSDGAGAKLEIFKENGVIVKVRDNRRLETNYSYSTIQGRKCLVEVEFPDDTRVNYGYGSFVESDFRPKNQDEFESNWYYVAVDRITDALGRSYGFSYTPDHTKLDETTYKDQKVYYVKSGGSLLVTGVDLPDDQHSSFRTESKMYSGPLWPASVRKNYVTDARGNSRVYEYTDKLLEIVRPAKVTAYDQYTFPGFILYKTMIISHYRGTIVGGELLGTETFRFSPDAAMALAEATDFSGNRTSYGYNQAVPNNPYASLQLTGTTFGYSNQPTRQINALGESKQYTYAHNVMSSATDELQNTTTYEVDEMGRRLNEVVVPAGALNPLRRVDYEFSSPEFKNFLTKYTVRRLSSSSPDPQWVTDLVTLYVPDSQGRVHHEVVDMNGNGTVDPAIDLITSYTYDANGNKRTATDPRGNETRGYPKTL